MTTEHEEAVKLAEKHGGVFGHGSEKLYIFSEPKIATLIADVRREERAKVDKIEMPTPDDIKGRFQSELFWKGAYAMREAIRARLEEA